MSQYGKIKVFIGPMFSGKTSEVIKRYKKKDQETIAVKPLIDTRSPTGLITSHIGMSIPAYTVQFLRDLEKITTLKSGQLLLIDEGQFFQDLTPTCVEFAKKGVKIYIAALNGTYDQKPWPSISAIIPHADRIVHLRTIKCQICFRCSAPFTKLRKHAIDSDAADDGPRILIGAQETYEPVCRKCLNENN